MKKKNNGNFIEFKSLEIKEQAVDVESRKVSGYLASFGNIDAAQDLIVKGAFLKSLAEHGPDSDSAQKIIFLYMHQMTEPLGMFEVLKEDDNGLYFEALVDETARGDQTLTQYKSGTINQHSFGYNYIWDKCNWETVGGEEAFVCHELKIYEGSPVSVGMNEQTPFLGFKGETNIEIATKLTAEINDAFKSNNSLHQKITLQKFIHLLDMVEQEIKSLKGKPSIDVIQFINNTKFL